jgi:phosphatidylglycerophosphate synthase
VKSFFEKILTSKNLLKRSNIPNAITIFRSFLVLPLVICALGRNVLGFVSLFVLIKVLDCLDGTIARRYGWVSETGSKLDSYADITTDLLAFWGFFIIKPVLFTGYGIFWFISFTALFSGWAYGYIAAKRLVILHLKTNKIFGSLYLSYLVIGVVYKPVLLIIMAFTTFAVLAAVEQILIFRAFGKKVDLETEGILVDKVKMLKRIWDKIG